MIPKLELQAIIEKYHLKGLIENVKWEIDSNKKLTVNFMAPTREMVEKKDIPEAGTYTESDKVPDQPGSEIKGTFKGAEETEEVDTLPEDAEAGLKPEDEKPEIEIELGKKMESMAYRIEEMEKKIAKMEAMMPATDEKVVEEVEEEMELPKLDGAPVEEAMKFSIETNRKNYGKKEANSQSSFLSKLYK